MELSGIQKSLSFDDVLIKPARSEVLPNHVLTKISLTKKINLEIPSYRLRWIQSQNISLP